VQLACALETGAQAMVTHDRDFDGVEGLTILQG
jgi:predicted nucleic acid-binding protein